MREAGRSRRAHQPRRPRRRFGRFAHYGTREFAQLSHSFLDMAEQLVAAVGLHRDLLART